MVQVSDRDQVLHMSVRDVQDGDRVLVDVAAGRSLYQPVVSCIVADPNASLTMKHVELSDGLVLRATRRMLLLGGSRPHTAVVYEDIEAGDVLTDVWDQPHTVASAAYRRTEGVYRFATKNNTIVVDGFRLSCMDADCVYNDTLHGIHQSLCDAGPLGGMLVKQLQPWHTSVSRLRPWRHTARSYAREPRTTDSQVVNWGHCSPDQRADRRRVVDRQPPARSGEPQTHRGSRCDRRTDRRYVTPATYPALLIRNVSLCKTTDYYHLTPKTFSDLRQAGIGTVHLHVEWFHVVCDHTDPLFVVNDGVVNPYTGSNHEMVRACFWEDMLERCHARSIRIVVEVLSTPGTGNEAAERSRESSFLRTVDHFLDMLHDLPHAHMVDAVVLHMPSRAFADWPWWVQSATEHASPGRLMLAAAPADFHEFEAWMSTAHERFDTSYIRWHVPPGVWENADHVQRVLQHVSSHGTANRLFVSKLPSGVVSDRRRVLDVLASLRHYDIPLCYESWFDRPGRCCGLMQLLRQEP